MESTWNCDLDSSIPDWIIEYPETYPLFQECGIDSSCGGKSLEYVCRERGLDSRTMLDELRTRIVEAKAGKPEEFSSQ